MNFRGLHLRRLASVISGGQTANLSLRERFLRSASWSVLGSGLSQGLGLMTAIFVARMLGAEGFGELGIITSNSATLGIFAGFGLGLTATKYIAEFRRTDPARAGQACSAVLVVAWVTSLLAALVLLVSAPYLAAHLYAKPHLAGLIRISSVTLVFNTLIGIQNAALGGFEAFRESAMVDVARGLCYFPVMIVGAYFLELKGAVIGLGLVATLGWFVGRVLVNRVARAQGVTISGRVSLRQLSMLWSFSLPVALSNMFNALTDWVCRTLMVNQPGGYRELGYYNAASQWTQMIMFLPMTLSTPALSLLSNMYGERRPGAFRKLLLGNLALVGTVTAVIATLLAWGAPWIVRVYGKDFASSLPVLRLLCAMVVLLALLRVTSQALFAAGRVRAELLFGLMRIAVLLTTFALVLDRGAVGLAITWVVSCVFSLLTQGSYTLAMARNLPAEPPAGPVPAAPWPAAHEGGEPR